MEHAKPIRFQSQEKNIILSKEEERPEYTTVGRNAKKKCRDSPGPSLKDFRRKKKRKPGTEHLLCLIFFGG